MKYIVYLTINLINHKIYIGLHQIDGDGKDYYLGNGVYGNKPHTYAHPKFPFQFAVKKYGPKNFRRVTLASFDSLDDALKLEATLVNEEFLKRTDVYNVVQGGGKLPKTSKCLYLYDLNGVFIQEFESVRLMESILGFKHSSVLNAVRFKSTSHGFLWSYEKHDKLDISLYCIFDRHLDLYIYKSDGTLDQKVNSIKEAAKLLNVQITRIVSSLKTGEICNIFYVSRELFDKYEKPSKKSFKHKPIYLYELNGKFIKKWDNITDVWKYFKLSTANPIINAIKKHQLSCGFLWSLSKFNDITPYKTLARKVGIYKDGKLILTYPSVKSFRQEHSSYEWTCLKGGNITSDGRLIKYIS